MKRGVETFIFGHARARDLLTRGLRARPPRLDWSACSVALLVDDDFTVEEVEAKLDALGDRVTARIPSNFSVAAQLQALRTVLVEEEGFSGGAFLDDAPSNSALHHVLTRKTGLPITLSVLYLEVARRAGLALVGVSFPAHFLVATAEPGERLVLDPFHHGQLLTGNGCEELLAKVAPAVRFSPRLLLPASVQTITTRMLSNLKRTYLALGDGARALNVVDQLLMLVPDHPGELRDRADILSALGAYQAALVDVERCLELSPDAPDQRNLRLAAKTLKRHVDYLN
jgi:regulator of sirC expression with transglutaminase-like and TPR domain